MKQTKSNVFPFFHCLNTDILYIVTSYLYTFHDHVHMHILDRQTRRQMESVGFSGFFRWLNLNSGVNINIETERFLMRHLQTSYALHAMVHACDEFILQFEVSKCIYQHHHHTPVRMNLAHAICPHVNEFRACAKDWLLGRMCSKLLKNSHHECGETVADDNDGQHQKLCKKVLNIIYRPLGREPANSWLVNDDTNNFVRRWTLSQPHWGPVLDSSSAVKFTSVDVQQIEKMMDKIDHFVGVYKRTMNTSNIFSYSNYRRDMQSSRRTLVNIRASLRNNSFNSFNSTTDQFFVQDGFSLQ